MAGRTARRGVWRAVPHRPGAPRSRCPGARQRLLERCLRRGGRRGPQCMGGGPGSRVALPLSRMREGRTRWLAPRGQDSPLRHCDHTRWALQAWRLGRRAHPHTHTRPHRLPRSDAPPRAGAAAAGRPRAVPPRGRVGVCCGRGQGGGGGGGGRGGVLRALRATGLDPAASTRRRHASPQRGGGPRRGGWVGVEALAAG